MKHCKLAQTSEFN